MGIEELLSKIINARKKKSISAREVEKALNIGKGWVGAIENGTVLPTFDLILSLAEVIGFNLSEVLADIKFHSNDLSRSLKSSESDGNLILEFRYGDYKAKYIIKDGTNEQFEELLSFFQECRNNEDIDKTSAVVLAFDKAVSIWTHVNPSDIWWFIVSRLYMDPYNHPSSEIHRDLSQSWKRTSGWALERIFVDRYKSLLNKQNIIIDIYKGSQKSDLLKKMNLNYHVESNKADVLLVDKNTMRCFGVAHVKASIAERRQNDQNFSNALMSKNYFSPFITMDCKSVPSINPVNKGELGKPKGKHKDLRTDKRKEFEEEGYFSGCFSFNLNTVPTPQNQMATARIYQVQFDRSPDDFVKQVVSFRNRLFGI